MHIIVSPTERPRDQAEPGADFSSDHGHSPAALRRTWLAAPVALRAANLQRHAGLERSRAALLSIITNNPRHTHCPSKRALRPPAMRSVDCGRGSAWPNS